MFTQPLATVYKTKADYLLSGLTVCLLIRCFEEFSANQKIQGGLTWRHLSDSFLTGLVTQDLMKQSPEWA